MKDQRRPPRVLVVSQYWGPDSGAGAAHAAALLLDELDARAGPDGAAQWWILTGDRAVGGPSTGDADGWTTERAHRRVQRGPWGRRTLPRLRGAVREAQPDVVYCNSLFAPGALAALLLQRVGRLPSALVIAPEGECDPAALAQRPRRKRAVLRLVRAAGMVTRTRWRAADASEAADLRQVLGVQAAVTVAGNVIAPPSPAAPRGAKAPGTARLAYVGTITPKKGLHRLAPMLAAITGDVHLDVVGAPGHHDDAYLARCRTALADLPATVSVAWHGRLGRTEVDAVLAAADLLVLPTAGESFGYVVAEALAAGCPVLISDQTPWHGLADEGGGWDLPLDDLVAWQRAIQSVVTLDAPARTAMATAAQARAARRRAEADPTPWRSLLGLREPER
jgi:glycosyltransferase involved in cell wall biosynthesis